MANLENFGVMKTRNIWGCGRFCYDVCGCAVERHVFIAARIDWCRRKKVDCTWNLYSKNKSKDRWFGCRSRDVEEEFVYTSFLGRVARFASPPITQGHKFR